MTNLTVTRDEHSTPTYGVPYSDDIFNAVMTADTDTSLSIPVDAKAAMVTADGDFYYADAALTIPAGAAFAGGNAILNPTLFHDLTGVTTMHFRASNTRRISVVFFTGQI